MWQRFTERARKVVFYAQEEAGRLGENFVSTEHLLLGLIREDDSVAARILARMGVRLEQIRTEVERQVARGDGRLGQDMQLTPRAKRVIDLAYDEARQLNNNYIGTEHLLLGLIREGEGLAGRILAKLGVDLDRARREIMHIQDSGVETKAAADDLVKSVYYSKELHDATQLASLLGHAKVMPVHLAVIALSEPSTVMSDLLEKFGTSAELLLAAFPESESTTTVDQPTTPTLSYEAGAVLVSAIAKSRRLFQTSDVNRLHLLLALLEEPDTVGPILRAAGLNPYSILVELMP